MIELNIKTIYYDAQKPILKDIEMTIEKGEIVALTGASGIGKSTILKCIAGIHKGFEGVVSLPKDSRMAFIYQSKCLLPWKSVYSNITLLKKVESGHVNKENADKLIQSLGLSGFEKKYPLFLSGGQYQRAALGQAFFYEPDILLMDEPFSALDKITKKEVQDLFLMLQKQFHITALLVTHDEEEARYLGSRIIHLENRRIKL